MANVVPIAQRPVPVPVEQRSDQRGQHRERRHGDQQEQGDLTAGLTGGDAEDRAHQRHRQGGITGGVDGVQLDQPCQPRLAGAAGVREDPESSGARPTSMRDQASACVTGTSPDTGACHGAPADTLCASHSASAH